jgi:AbrB family looped-hinge helix DNA binding protein
MKIVFFFRNSFCDNALLLRYCIAFFRITYYIAIEFIQNERVMGMQESKVTARGQTTLPRDVRAALGLEAGDSVRYIVENGRVQMLKARHVRELSGMLRRPGQRTVSLEEMSEAIAEGAVESAS